MWGESCRSAKETVSCEKNILRIKHFCWSQMTRFAKMSLQMHPIEKPQLSVQDEYHPELFSN